jgi:hypothetical protein
MQLPVVAQRDHDDREGQPTIIDAEPTRMHELDHS